MHVNVVIFYNLGEYHTDSYATMTTDRIHPSPNSLTGGYVVAPL